MSSKATGQVTRGIVPNIGTAVLPSSRKEVQGICRQEPRDWSQPEIKHWRRRQWEKGQGNYWAVIKLVVLRLVYHGGIDCIPLDEIVAGTKLSRSTAKRHLVKAERNLVIIRQKKGRGRGKGRSPSLYSLGPNAYKLSFLTKAHTKSFGLRECPTDTPTASLLGITAERRLKDFLSDTSEMKTKYFKLVFGKGKRRRRERRCGYLCADGCDHPFKQYVTLPSIRITTAGYEAFSEGHWKPTDLVVRLLSRLQMRMLAYLLTYGYTDSVEVYFAVKTTFQDDEWIDEIEVPAKRIRYRTYKGKIGVYKKRAQTKTWPEVAHDAYWRH